MDFVVQVCDGSIIFFCVHVCVHFCFHVSLHLTIVWLLPLHAVVPYAFNVGLVELFSPTASLLTNWATCSWLASGMMSV